VRTLASAFLRRAEMARSIRFVVHERVGSDRRQVGLFTAAYHLSHEGLLLAHDQERLQELLGWFVRELPVPPCGTIPPRALFWYVNAGPFARRMWEMAALLKEYRFTAELIKARVLGRVVYRDEHQLAALPPGPRQRARAC
jgi:hypothetical protein